MKTDFCVGYAALVLEMLIKLAFTLLNKTSSPKVSWHISQTKPLR